MKVYHIYYSKFAKDHTMFVMDQSWNGSHPETHWKLETQLSGCDCITWVTHKLLTVVAAGNWTDWDIFVTLTFRDLTFWNLHFGGLGKPPCLRVCFFDDIPHVNYCSHLVYSNDIQKINMSSKTCRFDFMCDTHAVKYNTALNSDPLQNVSSISKQRHVSDTIE